MEDIQKYGGTPAVMRYLLDKKMINGNCMTCTGSTIAENLKNTKPIPIDNPIVLPVESPLKPNGHIQILYGNLAPEGSVAKITGKEGLVFKGTTTATTIIIIIITTTTTTITITTTTTTTTTTITIITTTTTTTKVLQRSMTVKSL